MIHSTKLIYCLKYGKIYWVSAIAYYQKKRDKLRFVERLLTEWGNRDYEGLDIEPTKWDKNTIEELQLKEEFEQKAILQPKKDIEANKLIQAVDYFNSTYVKEWYQIMLLAQFKKLKLKDEFQEVFNTRFTTEFGIIKEHIKY